MMFLHDVAVHYDVPVRCDSPVAYMLIPHIGERSRGNKNTAIGAGFSRSAVTIRHTRLFDVM